MASEVFRPTDGPLLIRDNLAAGLGESAEVFRKNRPESRGGYRFGQLSYNSFFARHNPHPSRVRHLKGLLDVPICSVNDDGALSNPRYSHPQFPPSNHEDQKIQQYARYYKVPVNAINVNSQRHPINTITGLQYFQGKALNMRIFKEKAVPKVGMGARKSPIYFTQTQPLVPVTEGWRDELKTLTMALGAASPAANHPQLLVQEAKPGTGTKPRTCQYSAETGRLIPPPSRAMSRGNSRGNSRASARQDQFMNKLEHIAENPDLEGQVLMMLCQILQTDDLSAVKAWLVNGSDREKEQVLGMIRAALDSNDQYYKHNPDPNLNIDYKAVEEVGRTLGSVQADRLTLDGNDHRPATANGVNGTNGINGLNGVNGEVEPPTAHVYRPSNVFVKTPSPRHEHAEATRPPVLPDIFKPNSSGGSRPGSKQARTPTLKYTRVPTPSGGGRAVTPGGQDAQLQSMMEDKHHVWEPLNSVAVRE